MLNGLNERAERHLQWSRGATVWDSPEVLTREYCKSSSKKWERGDVRNYDRITREICDTYAMSIREQPDTWSPNEGAAQYIITSLCDTCSTQRSYATQTVYCTAITGEFYFAKLAVPSRELCHTNIPNERAMLDRCSYRKFCDTCPCPNNKLCDTCSPKQGSSVTPAVLNKEALWHLQS